MQYTILNFLEFLGSFGVFVIGLKSMSEGLQKVSRDGLRSLFDKVNKNSLSSFLAGFILTGVTQSSSSVVVLAVSFVNAQILKLRNAFQVVIGSNIGTVSTIWILAFISDVDDIVLLILPIIGLTSPLLFSGLFF